MVHASRGRPGRRFYLTSIMLVLVAAFAAAGTALAASNSLRVKVTKKQLAFTGTAAAASDSVEVHFDPNKCAASYARETKRKRVASTDFQVRTARHFHVQGQAPDPAASRRQARTPRLRVSTACQRREHQAGRLSEP
jgi:hypothetical protein